MRMSDSHLDYTPSYSITTSDNLLDSPLKRLFLRLRSPSWSTFATVKPHYRSLSVLSIVFSRFSCLLLSFGPPSFVSVSLSPVSSVQLL